jgi:asparagine synthase (glutamine-hydrolysing)
MCGIVAMFSRSGPIHEKLLERATHSLKHRGPESQRCWISPDQRAGLGHARLSIIDLTTGDQPIANEDESLRIVVTVNCGVTKRGRRNSSEMGTANSFRQRDRPPPLREARTQCLHRLQGELPSCFGTA